MTKEKAKELERVKVINIKGDKFTFDISKVSVDDYLTIENEKIRITSGGYSKIATSLLASAFTAATIVDMIATFRVLMPTIEDTIPTKDFSKLSIFDIKELLKIYVEEFSPWYSAWMKEFNSPIIPEEDNQGEDEKK